MAPSWRTWALKVTTVPFALVCPPAEVTSADAAGTVDLEAHGLVTDEIFEASTEEARVRTSKLSV